MDIIEIPNKPTKERNFSFINKNSEEFDNIEIDGEELIIPATIGSTFWAIIKVLYHHIDEPVFYQELTSEVEELMKDRDENAWNNYINKTETTVYKRLTGLREKKEISPWPDRIISNTRTLTRTKGNFPYGKRLMELGFKLEHVSAKQGNYFLLTKTNG